MRKLTISNSNLADGWFIFNNIGGICDVENGIVLFLYSWHIGIDGFNKIVEGAIHSFKFGILCILLLREKRCFMQSNVYRQI